MDAEEIKARHENSPWMKKYKELVKRVGGDSDTLKAMITDSETVKLEEKKSSDSQPSSEH